MLCVNMEAVPETIISNILSKTTLYDLCSLLRVSKNLSVRIGTLTDGNYIWKLMTESYLGVQIPYYSNDWENVYKFVVLIGKNNHLLYTRDVFYANLGVFLGIRIGEVAVREACINASVDTIEFLLSLPLLEKVWYSMHYIYALLRERREDIAMLLILDGRCLKQVSDIYDIATTALNRGCGKVFIYLIENYPQHIDQVCHLSGYYLLSCCYGLDDVVNKIEELDHYSSECSKYRQPIAEFIQTGIMPIEHASDLEDRISNGIFIYGMIVSGYVSQAYELYSKNGCDDKLLYHSIYIGLRNGTIVDFSHIEPFVVNDNKLVLGLLSRIVSGTYYNEVIVTILKACVKLLDNKDIKSVTKQALSRGNWRCAVVISNC